MLHEVVEVACFSFSIHGSTACVAAAKAFLFSLSFMNGMIPVPLQLGSLRPSGVRLTALLNLANEKICFFLLCFNSKQLVPTMLCGLS